jgi:hypothetical protein
VNALTLVRRLHLLALCRVALHLARQRFPPPLPAGLGGAPRVYRDESLVLRALLRTLWRLSYQDLHDWLVAWPALALACGLLVGPDGRPRVPSKAQQSKRGRAAGAPASEMLFVLLVRAGLWMGLTRVRPSSPSTPVGLSPAHLAVWRDGLTVLFLLSHANVHDAPFARPLLELAVRFLVVRPRVVRLDAGYWGLKPIVWIHTTLRARAVIP